MHVYRLITSWTLALCCAGALGLGCDDSSGDGTTDDAGRPPRGGDAAGQGVDDAARGAPDGPVEVATDATVPDAAPDATPPPAGCVDDDACPGPDICYDGRCIPNARCDVDTPCAPTTRCIAGICVNDPNAVGALVAEPEVVAYTFARVGEMQTRGLRITNGGAAVATVSGLEIDAPMFVLGAVALPARLPPGESLDLTIEYTADDDMADMGTLHVTAEAGPSLDVALRSSRKVVRQGDPCLEVRPQRLDFGGVARGQVDMKTFRLSACSDVPVNVLAIRRGVSFFGPLPDTFQLDPLALPQAIQPGQFIDVGVSYAPRRAGIEGGHFEVVSDDAAEPSKRVEVFALAQPPPLGDIALHVRLNWDTDLTDVDLHLLGPNGQMWTCEGDCYFSNANPNWGDPNEFRDDPFLDVDDVDGFGPENINLEAPAPGTYRVVVQYWADHGGDVPSSVVEVLNFGQVIGRYGPERTASSDDEWAVVDIEWPAMVLTPVGGVVNRARGALCGGF